MVEIHKPNHKWSFTTRSTLSLFFLCFCFGAFFDRAITKPATYSNSTSNRRGHAAHHLTKTKTKATTLAQKQGALMGIHARIATKRSSPTRATRRLRAPTLRSLQEPAEEPLELQEEPQEEDLYAYTMSREGECSNVPYGNLTVEDYPGNAVTHPEELPLNELLVHLDHPAFVTPPNPHGPTIVDIGVHINAISDLDPGTNSFVLEGYLDMVWCDPRTKFISSKARRDPNRQHQFLEHDAAKELERIWEPSLTFANENGARTIEDQELIKDADGTIEYREKFAVKLSSNYDMHRFPFDRQVLYVELESFAWNAHVLELRLENDLVTVDELDIPEHSLIEVKEYLAIKQEARDRYPFSELVTQITVQRNPTYYLTKVIIPLTLIVCISWAVFWMDCDALADRMAISFTGVLTSVAYQFVVSDILPRHIFNTFLDNFVLITFIMMNLTVVENIAVHNLNRKGFVVHAECIDKVCRIFFPIMFVISLFILAGAQIITDYLPAGGILGLCFLFGVILVVFVLYLVYIFRQRLAKKEDKQADKDEDADVVKDERAEGEAENDHSTKSTKSELHSRDTDDDDSGSIGLVKGHNGGDKNIIGSKNDKDGIRIYIGKKESSKSMRQRYFNKKEGGRGDEEEEGQFITIKPGSILYV